MRLLIIFILLTFAPVAQAQAPVPQKKEIDQLDQKLKSTKADKKKLEGDLKKIEKDLDNTKGKLVNTAKDIQNNEKSLQNLDLKISISRFDRPFETHPKPSSKVRRDVRCDDHSSERRYTLW